MMDQLSPSRIIPEIRIMPFKRLVGMRMQMSLTDNKTGELWQRFMLRMHEGVALNKAERFSLQIYPPGYHASFDPAVPFEKWAAMEAGDPTELPDGMELFTLPEGLYAVFHYTGLSTDTRIFQYIFTEWLPSSGYELDDRPHFEILGEKYRNGDPASEEEIWIPVKAKL